MASNRIRGITVEINGDTTKLIEALKNVDKSLETTQTALKDINKLLKLDPTNVTLLKQKQDLLKTSIADTKERLKTLKEAYKNLDNDGTEEAKRQQQALEREIAATEQSLKELKSQYREFGSVAKQQLQAVGEKLQEIGDKMTEAGKTLTTKVTVPLVAGFAAATKTAADFEAEMSKVEAISGANDEEMEKLTKKAREMGATTKFTATEAGQAFEYMAMAGWKSEDMLAGIEGIMDLAAASGEDLASVSDIVTDALTAFGLTAEDTNHFVDVLAAASSNSNTNVALMGETFKYVAPVAGALGYTVDDTAVAIGLLANAGIKGSQAGTSLRTILTNLVKPSEQTANVMNELGISLEDGQGNMLSFRQVMDQLRKSFANTKIPQDQLTQSLAALDAQLEDGTITESQYQIETERLMERAYGAEGALKAQAAAAIGGQRGMSSLLAIVNAAPEDYDQLTAAIDGASGAAGSMAATMQDNLAGRLTELKSQLQELMIQIGERLTPIIEKVIEWVKEAINWLDNLDEDQKDLIVTIGLVVAAIGPVLVIVGTVIKVLGTLSSAIGFLASPIGIAIAAIAALVAGGVALYKNWDTVKAKATELWQSLRDKFEQIKNSIGEKIQAAKDKVVSIFDSIKSTVQARVDLIKAIVGAAFEIVKTKILTPIENARDKVREIVDKIKSFFSNLHISLPHIELPHFSIKGKFSLNPPQVPRLSIDWYAKAMQNGMILDHPTIFGAMGDRLLAGGEAGREVVVGANSLMGMIQKATTGARPEVNVSVVVNGNVDNYDALAETIGQKLAQQMARQQRAFT